MNVVAYNTHGTWSKVHLDYKRKEINKLTSFKAQAKKNINRIWEHMGRGKFKNLAPENAGDKYINKIVDTSDVFSCKREWELAVKIRI